MRIISVINQKGGCGKTTTAINLSASLSQRGRRVLLIDLDPQGHASLGFNVKPENITRGMTEVLTQRASLDDVMCESIRPNLDLAPATITLSAVEQLLSGAIQKERRLLNAIERTQRTYDYIIIDAPPNLGILTFNALRSSELSIIPIEMGFFSLHGIAKLKETTDELCRQTGHRVELRALPTMVNIRTRFTREVLEELDQHFEGHMFHTRIRNNVRLREATSHGIPITEYQPTSNGALDYQAVADEVVALEVTRETRLPNFQVPVLNPILPVLRRELSL